jgi:hypothetical protein
MITGKRSRLLASVLANGQIALPPNRAAAKRAGCCRHDSLVVGRKRTLPVSLERIRDIYRLRTPAASEAAAIAFSRRADSRRGPLLSELGKLAILELLDPVDAILLEVFDFGLWSPLDRVRAATPALQVRFALQP